MPRTSIDRDIPAPDWADELALQLSDDLNVPTLPSGVTLALVAARLRLVYAKGEASGIHQARKIVEINSGDHSDQH